MSNDPFASATAGAGSNDPFGQKPSEVKTSSFPTMEDLDKHLLVIQPTKLERVPDTFSKEPGAMRDRISADVTVINAEKPSESATHRDMYISQGALVGQLKGFIETRGMLLGTLRRFPARNSPDVTPITARTVNDPDSTDLLMQEWVQAGAKGNKPSFAWKLADFTNTEKDAALEWYRSKAGK
jgi:hypothetical protein